MQTCHLAHALVYGASDQYLWRQLFLTHPFDKYFLPCSQVQNYMARLWYRQDLYNVLLKKVASLLFSSSVKSITDRNMSKRQIQKHRRRRACSGYSKSMEHILVVRRIVLGCKWLLGDYIVDFVVLQ